MPFKHPIIKLITLGESFASDRLDYEQKQQRDQQISVAANANTPAEQIEAWLDDQASDTIRNTAEHWLFSWHLVQLIVFCVGLASGAGLASLVLHYDGSQPINIISAWLVLAGLPFLLMCLWLLTLLPFKLPVVSLLSDVIQRAVFQPISRWLLHRLNKSRQSTSSEVFDFMPSQQSLFSMSSILMQWFALGVGLGALVSAFYLLASSDLAFAWSTSFDIKATQLHSITSLISAPFSGFIEVATPSLDVIQKSHYFRLEEASNQQFTNKNAADQLTQWWPFLLTSITAYAVLPRIVTLVISHYRLKQSITSDIRALPDYAGLIARMSAPLLTTRHTNSPSEDNSNTPETKARPVPYSLSAALVNWGQIEIAPETLQQALEKIGLNVEAQFSAGGRNSIGDDSKIIEHLKQSNTENVLVIVKAWEPPLLEFRDWVGQLRKAVKGAIIVLPVDPDNHLPSKADISLWRTDLQQLADQALYVEGLTL